MICLPLRQGGPGARSCHKLCFDPQTRSIYVLGRFLESWAVAALKPEADFYRYRIDEIRWEKISGNTAVKYHHLAGITW